MKDNDLVKNTRHKTETSIPGSIVDAMKNMTRRNDFSSNQSAKASFQLQKRVMA